MTGMTGGTRDGVRRDGGVDRGGVVLTFPARPKPAAAPDRLNRALADLLTATREQAVAVAAWRAALAELAGSVAGLATSIDQYKNALSDTGAQVGELGRAMRRLESTLG